MKTILDTMDSCKPKLSRLEYRLLEMHAVKLFFNEIICFLNSDRNKHPYFWILNHFIVDKKWWFSSFQNFDELISRWRYDKHFKIWEKHVFTPYVAPNSFFRKYLSLVLNIFVDVNDFSCKVFKRAAWTFGNSWPPTLPCFILIEIISSKTFWVMH